MNDLLFIRHAETDLAGTFCGHSNPPVNKEGDRQIQELLKALRATPIDAVYTSDLQRAATTAEALAKAFQCSCVMAPGLREISFGHWEGLRWREIEMRDKAYAQRWLEAYPELPAPGGESLGEFHSRVLSEVRQLLTLTGHGCLAVVTHAGVMRAVLRTFCGLDEQDAWEQTGSYCCFFKYAHKGDR